MASSANPQHEPTMEEILASIRKIISEDSSETSAPRPEAEVLDLTQEVKEQPSPASPAAMESDESVTREASRLPAAGERHEENEGIFSQRARQAIDEAFAKIDQPEEWQTPPRSEGTSMVEGDSVEAVFERAVRSAVGPEIRSWMKLHGEEMLSGMTPLIREWMDEHFPAILEGAIREEVARVVKARGRR